VVSNLLRPGVWYAALIYLDAKPPKIILMGDSAGGNIGMALTSLLIKLRHRVPDALLMVYPGLECCLEKYSPSKLFCLEDYLVSDSLLRTCRAAYVQGEGFDIVNDPFLSPVATKDELLKHFPRTRLFVGNADPLFDDCIRLTERLL